jgi:hypothetical protein
VTDDCSVSKSRVVSVRLPWHQLGSDDWFRKDELHISFILFEDSEQV